MNNKLIKSSKKCDSNIVSRETPGTTRMAGMETRHILRKLLDQAEISEWRLSDVTGVSQSTINAILSGRSKEQKDSTLEPLAAYFSVSLKQLRGYDPIEGVTEGKRPHNEYPVLTSTADIIAAIGGDTSVRESAGQYVTSAYPKGPACFVYTMTDDSMDPVLGKGAWVFVDPNFQYPEGVPVTGMKLALIKVGDRLAIRSEADDLGEIVYKPINSGFRTVLDSDCERIGYVVGMPEQDFTKSTDPEAGRKQLKGV